MAQQLVDGTAIDGEQGQNNTCNDNPGQKVRQINNGLNPALQPAFPDLVQGNGDNNRSREPEDQVKNTQGKGVPDYLQRNVGLEQNLKVFQPHPRA
ncbi:hypothetical protein D3C75_1249430 [compost metagenome]